MKLVTQISLLGLSILVTGNGAIARSGYDYIVVGGGTAGAALATRLSLGLPSSSILVIEAGPAAPDELGINVPGRKGSTLGGIYDWNFTTIAQEGLGGRAVGINRGKVLGGSSALNLLVWDRAAAAEYDAWEDMGSEGWNWENMIKAMNKAENFTGISSTEYDNASGGIGEGGPIQAVINRLKPAHQDAFIPTVNESFGIPINLNSLGGDSIGVGLQPNSIDPTHYNRSYSANAYMPAAGANLETMLETMVTKINFRKGRSGLVATGVTLDDGTVVKAHREVIVSAGSVQSPGLLELSGIGQAEVLSAAGIEQLLELEGVGENYQDHIRTQISYELKENYTSFDALKNATRAAEEMEKWINGEISLFDYGASGFIFANWEQIAGSEGNAELKSLARDAIGNSTSIIDQKKLDFMEDMSVPQLEVIFSDGYTGVKGYPAVDDELSGKNFFTLLAGLMHPLSRGSIHINPEDILGKPIIDPGFQNNEHDIQALVKGIKFCREVAKTSPMSEVWVSEYEPGLDEVNTDEEWREFVLGSTLSIFHPTGTCAMMPEEEGGVVDSALIVYGTDNLRVVDASVFPVQISAHIQSAVYGVAERAAEMIIASARSGEGGNGCQ